MWFKFNVFNLTIGYSCMSVFVITVGEPSFRQTIYGHGSKVG